VGPIATRSQSSDDCSVTHKPYLAENFIAFASGMD
jgi:hypothetical protein